MDRLMFSSKYNSTISKIYCLLFERWIKLEIDHSSQDLAQSPMTFVATHKNARYTSSN